MNTQSSRIPVTIVTGFLGSGKTTLLNRLLGHGNGKRIAIIENEFGEVSIDDALLVESNQTVFRMSDGCLCCTINGDLIKTLEDLLERRAEFDYLIIETTGIANPVPVVQTFMVNEDIAEAFVLDAVVTTVDAKHVLQHVESKECQAQIALADILIINKLDLVDTAQAEQVEQQLRTINGVARVFKTERSALALSDILGQGLFNGEHSLLDFLSAHADEPGHEHHDCDHDHDHCQHEHQHDHQHLHSHHHDEDVQSVGIELNGRLDRDRFNLWFSEVIQSLGDRIYRCKGILRVDGDQRKMIVQTVHRVSEVVIGADDSSDEPVCKIVFIGRSLDREALVNGFKACLAQ